MNQKLFITAAYYLSFILLGMMGAVEGPALLKLADHTSSAIDQISWIFFFGALGYLAGSYFSGKLFDRVNGHRLLSAALIGMGALSIFVPLANSLIVLIAILFVLGIFKSAVDVGCNTLLIWLYKDEVTPYMNGLHAFFGLGALLSPLIIAQSLSITADIHWAYWSFAILSVPFAALIWIFPSPLPRAVPHGHDTSKIPLIPALIMSACFVLYVGMEVGYGNWIYAYAVKLNLTDEVTASYLTSAFWGFFTIGRLAGIAISTRIKPLDILIIDLAGSLIATLLILFVPASITILWIGSILLGLSLASIFATLLALAEQRIHITGAITGWFLGGASIGGMIIPLLIGQAFDNFGAISMIWFVLISIILNGLALFAFVRLPRSPLPAGAG